MSPPRAGVASLHVAGDTSSGGRDAPGFRRYRGGSSRLNALSQRPKKRKSESEQDGGTGGTDQPRKRGRPKKADSESADNKKAAKKKTDDEKIDEDDPPWRTLGHPHIGRRVVYTSQQQTPSSRTVTVEQVGTVTGWIASTDVDQHGNPGFVSEYTREPADLFHVVFDDELGHPYFPLLLMSQDLEEREVLSGLLPADEKVSTANAAFAPPPIAANATTTPWNIPVPASKLVGSHNSQGSTPSALDATGEKTGRPAQRKTQNNSHNRQSFATEQASDAVVRDRSSGENPMINMIVRARNRVATVARGNECPRRDKRARKMIESLSKTHLRQKAKIAELSDRILKLGDLITCLLGTCAFLFVACIFLFVWKTH
jgi:hypothetical protein